MTCRCARHRPRERRQGAGRAGARCAPRARTTRCSSSRPRPMSSTTSASWPRPTSCSARGSCVLAACPRDRRAGPAARAAAEPRRARAGRLARRSRRPLRALAGSAATPGFAARTGDAVRRAPALARHAAALHLGAARLGGTRRRAGATYADGELGALYCARTAAGWSGSGAPTRRATHGRRSTRCAPRPAAWGARPVFLYGFDDSRRSSSTRSRRSSGTASAACCVALNYEPGRVAFAGRAATVEALRPLAAEPSSSRALGALRARRRAPRCTTWSGSCSSRAPSGARRTAPSGCWRRRRARGDRAVGAEVLRADRQGDRAGRHRRPAARRRRHRPRSSSRSSPATASRSSHERRSRSGARGSGAGVLAGRARRAARRPAGDLLTWLRTPGRLDDPARGRRARGCASAAASCAARAHAARAPGSAASAARRSWRSTRWPRRPPRAPSRCCARSRPRPARSGRRRTAARADGARGRGPRGRARRRRPARRVAELATWRPPTRRSLGGPRRSSTRSARSRSASRSRRPDRAPRRRVARPGAAVAGAPAGAPPAGVLLADPLAIRARRFRAVFVCGLQDGEFPRRPAPEPFLSDEDRRALAAASGLRLPLHEDALDRERSLFYAAVSRPEDVLFLSWRSSDEEGDPLAPSAVPGRRPRAVHRRAVGAARHAAARRRHLGAARRADAARAAARLRRAAVRARAGAARRARERRGARAARRARDRAGPRARVVRRLRRALARRAAAAPGAHRARPGADAARRARPRGARAHARAAARAHRLRPDRAGAARRSRSRRSRDALAERARAAREPARRRALLRGLEADLERYLRTEAECGAGYEPTELEWSFGGAEDAHGPLSLGGGGGLVTGRVDRVDVGPGGTAIVRDYKGRTVVGGVKWAEELQLQVALYLLAVRELLGLEPVAGLYQPLAGRKLGARGLVRDDVARRLHAHRPRRRATASRRARGRARARRAHGGRPARRPLAPCPERCSSRGCRYPGICRAGEPRVEAPA